MSFHATLHFSDHETREIDVNDGETVLEAALRSGHNLVHQCKVGTCATCVGFLRSGQADMPDGQISVLTKAEKEAGARLVCRTYLTSDAEVDLEYPSALLEANPPQLFRAKIARLDWVAENVVEMTCQLPKNIKFGFTAGQYCRIKVPGTDQWRSYSMASGEHERFKLTFLLRVLPDGVMSNYLRTARVGEVLELEGPLGGFVLEPESRPTILMAGGTGLAPMLSMLDRLRTVQPRPRILLLFSCKSAEVLFHTEELAARTTFMPNLEVRVRIRDNSQRPEIEVGNALEALRDDDVADGTVAYLCGPPGMIHAATERLTALGVPLHDVRSEQFIESAN